MTSTSSRFLLIAATMLTSMTSHLLPAQQTAPVEIPRASVERNPRDTSLPTIFIVGDSMADFHPDTHHEGATAVQGWGAFLGNFLDERLVNVVNAAHTGATARTYLEEGRWDEVLHKLHPNDIVLIQFGHDDAAANDAPSANTALSGHGPETRDSVSGAAHDGQKVNTYGWYLQQIIRQTKAHGAEPVVIAPIPGSVWKDGRPDAHGDYWAWARAVALQEGNTDFVDLTGIMARQLAKLGQVKAAALYCQDGHLNPAGAFLTAKYVVSGLKAALDAPISRYLSVPGGEVVPADELAFKYPKDHTVPTIWILGDSTVRNGDGTGIAGLWGWGEELYEMIDTPSLNVSNVAVSGRSSRSFYTADWPYIRPLIRPGDVVLMQFGHNDLGDPAEKIRSRASLAGVGAEVRTIDNPISQRKEEVHTYGWYLRQFIAETRQAGATPIICSPVPRNQWNGNKVKLAEPQQWSKQVADQEHIGFINLGELVARHYEELGRVRATELFADGGTHSTLEGATFIATTVLGQLVGLLPPNLHGRLPPNATHSSPSF